MSTLIAVTDQVQPMLDETPSVRWSALFPMLLVLLVAAGTFLWSLSRRRSTTRRPIGE